MRTAPECPVCGAMHSACTSSTGPIVVVQLPQRDARVAEVRQPESVAEVDASFSTSTYRGKGKR